MWAMRASKHVIQPGCVTKKREKTKTNKKKKAAAPCSLHDVIRE